MGIGRNRGVVTIAACLLLAGFFISQASALERRTGIWKVMRDGGFCGAMNEDANVWPIGNMDVGKWRYRFVHYEWLESKKNMQGSSPHGRTDLLIFERTKKGLVYLGGYNTHGGRPRIEGHTLVFPYKDYEILGIKVAKTITFDETGPPGRILLDGESFGFGK